MKKIIFLIFMLIIVACKPETKTGMAAQPGQIATETKVVIEEPKSECQDSDDGVTPDTAGKITGTMDGQEYTEYDKCLAGILVEYFCEDGKPVNQNVRCDAGKECKAGACR